MGVRDRRKVFAETLLDLLGQSGKTQKELAGALRVHPTTVGKWILGKAYPRGDVLEGMADYFGVPVSAFSKGLEHFSRETKVQGEGRYFSFSAPDSSMEPAIRKGDRVLIQVGEGIVDGRIAAVTVDGCSPFLCRIWDCREESVLVLRPDSPEHAPRLFPGAERGRVRILGLAVSLKRSLL